MLGTLLGIGGNLIGGAINNVWGLNMQNQARQENYEYGEQAAQNADQRTRALYKDIYSPQALMKQYKEAGLSPSLMFGGTPGQGGTSGAMGTGANGPGNTYMPMSILEGAQVAKTLAETKNVEADTKNKETQNENIQADTAQKWANAGLTKVSTALTEEQVKTQQWQNYITSETSRFTIGQAAAMAEEAAYSAISASFSIINAQVKAEVAEATKQAQIDQAIANVEWTNTKTLLENSNIQLNKQKIAESAAIIDKWREEVAQGWKKLEIDIYNSSTDRAKWRTVDNFMSTQEHLLRKRLNWEIDMGERQYTWMIMNDTFNSLTGAFNKAAQPPTNMPMGEGTFKLYPKKKK